VFFKYREVWFNLPGTASTLTPNDGTAQLCKTSEEVIKSLIWVFFGKKRGMSVFNNLRSPRFNSAS
jgi:hypothetical protein